MKARLTFALLLAALVIPTAPVLGLSRSIERDIEFPKDYDPVKAAAIRKVIQDDRFKFVDGLVSYWPPDWGTRLSYTGDAESLNEFLAALRDLKGISLRVVLYQGRDDEGRRDSPWQLDYSHARPNQLTVYLNLHAKELAFDKIALPEWQEK